MPSLYDFLSPRATGNFDFIAQKATSFPIVIVYNGENYIYDGYETDQVRYMRHNNLVKISTQDIGNYNRVPITDKVHQLNLYTEAGIK